jgi:hypothetical protein
MITQHKIKLYLDFEAKVNKELREFFSEYLDSLVKAEKALNEKKYKEAELFLNEIPKEVRKFWKPALRVSNRILYHNMIT